MEERKIKIDIIQSNYVDTNEVIFKQILKRQYNPIQLIKYCRRNFTACIESDEKLGLYLGVMFLKYRQRSLVVPIFGTAGFKDGLSRAKSIIRFLKILKNIIMDEFAGIQSIRISVRKDQSDKELVVRLLEKHNYKKVKEDEFKIIYKYERPV